MHGYYLTPEIKISDLLTSLSVLVAVAALIASWASDRRLRIREHADRIRIAASTALSKIDRCETLFVDFFDRIQPLITQIDMLFVEGGDVRRCRDELWTKLHDAYASVLKDFVDEEIELSYAPLFAYQPDIYEQFASAVSDARTAFLEVFREFLEQSQAAVLDRTGAKARQSAVLGNELRSLAGHNRKSLQLRLDGAVAALKQVLKAAVALNDVQIARRDAVAKLLQGVERPKPRHPAESQDREYQVAVATRARMLVRLDEDGKIDRPIWPR